MQEDEEINNFKKSGAAVCWLGIKINTVSSIMTVD
jgi:hypothetical protein